MLWGLKPVYEFDVVTATAAAANGTRGGIATPNVRVVVDVEPAGSPLGLERLPRMPYSVCDRGRASYGQFRGSPSSSSGTTSSPRRGQKLGCDRRIGAAFEVVPDLLAPRRVRLGDMPTRTARCPDRPPPLYANCHRSPLPSSPPRRSTAADIHPPQTVPALQGSGTRRIACARTQ
jgi:hypothetical protein